MSEILYWGNLACPWSKTIVFIPIGFTNWDLWSLSQGDMLQGCSEQWSCMACHMSLVHLQVQKFGPQKVNSVLFLGHLQEFHLDLCSPRYNNSPQVSCLGMNSGRGWNPNLEGSYLQEYSEYEAEFWKQCKSIFYIHPLQFPMPNPLPISRYSECTKT